MKLSTFESESTNFEDKALGEMGQCPNEDHLTHYNKRILASFLVRQDTPLRKTLTI